ncbi:hypothetical protein GBAR_LOCUS18327 [Geodia barretti]|uniref:Death domain-containing protein n=1 Tax=Geodia barretti TaxID=519541 RepID=A0AA35WSP8_GEOBA|nr:hypothetical protein GBAR_LOCUS18327 [Geodia barretti]
MPESQHDEIVGKFDDDEEAKRELITTWLAGHPCPTWEHVRQLLEGGVGGEEGERAAREVEETYLKMTPEKAKQILDAALQDGSFPLGFLKSMAVGVARSGKTLSKNHVFKIKCDPNCSVSTGVCEAPILAFRQLTLELIKALPSAEGFELLKYEDINQFLAYVVRKGLLKGRVAKVVKEMVQAASEGSSSSDRSEGVAASSVGTQASTAVVGAVCAASKARVEAEAKARTKGSGPKEEPLFKLQIILFLDSGGQPQFHEVVAAFSHNVSLVLVFIKLNERLDALCTNAFTDEEGKWFTEQCPSLLTNEQMVVQFVHTMMCKPVAGSEGMHTRFMVIGTHRDLMHECDETLEQKNERLASLFLPALEENLVMNGDDIIFAVNAKNPDENDDKCFDLIREKVADLSGALDVDTPIAFLVLLNDVNKYAEEQGKKVVSMEEFQAIAGRLKMKRQSLEAALVFFNEMSVWMYVPSVLPGAVFVDPQMPLDSINRIVQYSFRVGGGAITGLAASECRLWKEGVVSSEMLKGEEFRGCFVRGLFEAGDALKLFEKLYIVAPLNEREFIMPAMLQTVAEKDMERYVPAPSEHVSPLFLHFHMSRIAKGVFCSTHTCMRSKYGWTTAYTMVKSKKVPACLFRNAVRLQHPTKAVKITLLHALKHFEVHLDASQADLPIICPEIRDMLMDAVDSAASAFRFKNSRASVAFQCPCSPDDVHTATPNEDFSMLICKMTEDKIRGPLTPAQRVWLGPRTAPGTSSSSASVPVTLSSDPLCPSSTQKVLSLFSSSSSTTPSHQHLSAPPSRMVPQLVSSSRTGERDTTRSGDALRKEGSSTAECSSPQDGSLGEEDLVEITDQLMDLNQPEIYNLGLVLGLAHRRVVDLRENSRSNQAFLDAVVLHWLQRDDHVKEVSWAALVKALRHQRLGHTGIATSIAREYGTQL